LVLGGCTRLGKEAFRTVTGAKGGFTQAQAPTRPIGMYRRIEVGKITDSFKARTPPELLANLPAKILEHLQDQGLPTAGSGKTLIIEGEILYYEEASAAGHIFGPFEEVVSEIRLVDKDTKEVIATANCVGRTTTSMNKGVAHKTDGLAKGIVKWISDNYPKEGRPKSQ
jgi:hypothetical protein